MITIKVDDKAVLDMLKALPKQATRAAEIAIDKTAKEIKNTITQALPVVFDRPNAYTKNSLKLTPTHGHNMTAEVWFKEPDRMGEHYLVPQVEGTVRKHKGFERAFGNIKMVPGKHQRLDQYGNVSAGKILQAMSVLGRAERMAGVSRNATARSRQRNKAPRDFVYIPDGNKQGLIPGIYERFQTSRGFGAKTKRTLPFGVYQRGKTVGRFSSVVRARGLRPFLLKGKQTTRTRPRLQFYAIATQVFNRVFDSLFLAELAKRMP